jgi:hypothetical protein
MTIEHDAIQDNDHLSIDDLVRDGTAWKNQHDKNNDQTTLSKKPSLTHSDSLGNMLRSWTSLALRTKYQGDEASEYANLQSKLRCEHCGAQIKIAMDNSKHKDRTRIRYYDIKGKHAAYDHIYPSSKGWIPVKGGVQFYCTDCNSNKGDCDPKTWIHEQWAMLSDDNPYIRSLARPSRFSSEAEELAYFKTYYDDVALAEYQRLFPPDYEDIYSQATGHDYHGVPVPYKSQGYLLNWFSQQLGPFPSSSTEDDDTDDTDWTTSHENTIAIIAYKYDSSKRKGKGLLSANTLKRLLAKHHLVESVTSCSDETLLNMMKRIMRDGMAEDNLLGTDNSTTTYYQKYTQSFNEYLRLANGSNDDDTLNRCIPIPDKNCVELMLHHCKDMASWSLLCKIMNAIPTGDRYIGRPKIMKMLFSVMDAKRLSGNGLIDEILHLPARTASNDKSLRDMLYHSIHSFATIDGLHIRISKTSHDTRSQMPKIITSFNQLWTHLMQSKDPSITARTSLTVTKSPYTTANLIKDYQCDVLIPDPLMQVVVRGYAKRRKGNKEYRNIETLYNDYIATGQWDLSSSSTAMSTGYAILDSTVSDDPKLESTMRKNFNLVLRVLHEDYDSEQWPKQEFQSSTQRQEARDQHDLCQRYPAYADMIQEYDDYRNTLTGPSRNYLKTSSKLLQLLDEASHETGKPLDHHHDMLLAYHIMNQSDSNAKSLSLFLHVTERIHADWTRHGVNPDHPGHGLNGNITPLIDQLDDQRDVAFITFLYASYINDKLDRKMYSPKTLFTESFPRTDRLNRFMRRLHTDYDNEGPSIYVEFLRTLSVQSANNPAIDDHQIRKARRTMRYVLACYKEYYLQGCRALSVVSTI